MRRRVPVLSLLLLLVAAVAGGSLVVRPGATDRDARRAATAATRSAAVAPRLDTATEAWHLVVPPPAAPTAPTRRPVVARAEAPDWSALRAGVAPVADPAGATIALATAPAELDIALSARERQALIAAAREPEALPGPRNHRPGIAVIVPAGHGSDGICR